MSLVSLSKEQKQYLILGAIIAAVLAVLVVFGVRVSLSSISDAQLELQGLIEKIESGEKFLIKSRQEDPEFRSTISELKAHLNNIPPERNYYSWATETIYAEARMVRLEIDAIDEISIATKEDNSKELDQVELESYSLRITAHGGYEDVKLFLQRIARNHPLVRVTGIEISTGSKPEMHDVQLFMEWPFNLNYITESWKNLPVEKLEISSQDILDSSSASDLSHELESEESTSKKNPTPTAHLLESAPMPVREMPTALVNPGMPMVERKLGETGSSTMQVMGVVQAMV